MCFCTVLVLKISVVLSILLLVLFNVLDIIEGGRNLSEVTMKGKLLLVMCFVLNSFLIAILCAGLYAAIRQNLKLMQMILSAYFRIDKLLSGEDVALDRCWEPGRGRRACGHPPLVQADIGCSGNLHFAAYVLLPEGKG
ncbi:uncharacterized protein LOC108150888 isoform X3 [Drosophila miranda]|uniref:uncharacterized protein LOC108150888 isoform X3 n=1 Tax=Drosophila miranda TaxID=7229 RepID=UPI0007E5D64E|nr:uncharacterized protein LOC108150888 isoform X3 [Drosophila miranda]